MQSRFTDRRHAGRVLAQALSHLAGTPDLLVLALPRGGVPVAYEVARALDAPLDVFVVQKLGFPDHEEFAMGAIASGGVRALNPDLLRHFHVDRAILEDVTARERMELERRERLYRSDRVLAAIADRPVLLVDDGLTTGASMRAAISALKQHGPARIVVGVPVSAPEVCKEVGAQVDEIVCATTPERLTSVSRWYRNFTHTSDAEVRQLLTLADQERQHGISVHAEAAS